MLTFPRFLYWPLSVTDGGIVHTQPTWLLVKYKLVMGTQHLISKQTLVISLAFVTFTGSLWKLGRVHRFFDLAVCTSDRCLPDVRTRCGNTALHVNEILIWFLVPPPPILHTYRPVSTVIPNILRQHSFVQNAHYPFYGEET
jgi:hypothetical protein